MAGHVAGLKVRTDRAPPLPASPPSAGPWSSQSAKSSPLIPSDPSVLSTYYYLTAIPPYLPLGTAVYWQPWSRRLLEPVKPRCLSARPISSIGVSLPRPVAWSRVPKSGIEIDFLFRQAAFPSVPATTVERAQEHSTQAVRPCPRRITPPASSKNHIPPTHRKFLRHQTQTQRPAGGGVSYRPQQITIAHSVLTSADPQSRIRIPHQQQAASASISTCTTAPHYDTSTLTSFRLRFSAAQTPAPCRVRQTRRYRRGDLA